MTRSKLMWFLTVFLGIALVAAACGNDDSDGDAAPADEEATEGAEEATPAEEEPAEEEPAEDEATPEEEATEEDEVELAQSREGLYCVVTHENPGDSGFWSVVQNGAEAAGSDLGVEVRVSGDADVGNQADLVRNCIADGAVGIAASLANPEGMQDVMLEAAEAGVPTVTLNSGVNNFIDVGAITHVGQTETVAGEGAGLRLNDAGVTGLVLCVVHEEANIALEERCDGFASTYGGDVELLNVASTGTGDISGTQATLVDTLIEQSDVAAILTLNPDVGIAARDAIAEVGADVSLATFDLSPDVLDAIEAGEILFAIDQQQYLQGYLPVVFLALFNENLNTIGGGNAVLTGPGFVTEENAGDVKALADAGTR